MERLVGFQRFKKGDEFVQHLVIEVVAHVSTLLFGKDDLRIGQQLKVVGNGGLGQINEITEIHTIQTIVLLFDLLQNQETI